MAGASFVRSSLLGGEWSKFAQGRNDLPAYVTALNVCLNGLPIETGAWVRRPGFRFAQTTRRGLPGRVIKFDFQATAPYTMEFTDGHLRFFSGATLIPDTGSTIVAVSTANPAVVQTGGAVTWVTGDDAYMVGLGTVAPQLQGRVFTLTKIDPTHFSLADAVTGQNVDGAALGYAGPIGGIGRVLDFATPYVGGTWADVRVAQAEKTAFLLHGSVAPYALTVTQEPQADPNIYANFSLAPAVFNDGPYLDPFTNGVRATPSATSGVINITLSFAAWSATQAYAAGSFSTYSGVNYESLVDQNVNHQPDVSPTQWAAVSAGLAISPNGFQGTDVGRLVRFFSEPDLWAAGTAYVAGNRVAYNPSGLPGAVTYWNAKAGSTGKIPGTDTTNWEIATNAALWTWGKIVSLANLIDRALAGSVNIGTATTGGGLAAAFDGVTNQVSTACARAVHSAGAGTTVGTVSDYIGKNYSGASAQIVTSATVYPSSDGGFVSWTQTYNSPDGSGVHTRSSTAGTITVNLRAKATVPASASDGTLLGTSGLITSSVSAVSIQSSDVATAWNYVWLEFIYQATDTDLSPFYSISESVALNIAEVQFFGPAGSSAATAISVEILGPPLLYTTPVRTWRLGLYSDTTGWPRCGTYSDGRLWLSGAARNRVDACVSNGAKDGTIDFAPTDQNGNVLASSAISYTFNAPDTNPILWMTPDLQGIIAGTQAGEWIIQAPTAGPIGPTNVAARRVTKIGCANIEPVRTEHTTVFVQKFGRKIMEYFADVFSGKFTAPHITFTGKHLTKGGVKEIAYQQELAPVVWARVGAGNLIGCTYKRDTLMTSQGPTAAGGHRHTLGSGRVVESIAVGPSVGGDLDALTIVTNDPIGGIRHVEVMTDILDEDATLTDAWYLDNATAPSSTTAAAPSGSMPYGGLKLNGLWHLNGKTVQVWAGGLDCGVQENGTFSDFVVTNGSVTVPYGDGVSAGSAQGLFTADYVASFGGAMPIVVGFTYASDGQLVPPQSAQESGARAGPALGKLQRAHQFAAQLVGSQGVSFGTSFSALYPALFRNDAGTPYLINQQFTGIYRSTLNDSNSFSDSKICWRVTRPYPCNITNVGGYLQTQDA